MQIGQLKFKNPILLAPMEDVTDSAFRIICRKHGASMVYTEFASVEALVRNAYKTQEKIQFTEIERPIGIQLFGGSIDSFKKAIEFSQKLNPELIDINAGCWVKKVVKREEGAGLLKNLKKLENIIKTCVESTKLPVTLKTRLGWDSDNIVILEAAKIAENNGIKALTVHCRTRKQGYRGKADWTWLEKIKNNISIPLIGNGDIITSEDAKKVFDYGCDGVMIGRGAIGNPWIFKEINHFITNKTHLPPPSIKERVNTLLEHLKLIVEFKGFRGLRSFRKFYSNYLKGIRNSGVYRKKLVLLDNYDEIKETLLNLTNSQP